ncbi:hypothetical protein ACIQM4_25735 [Streptomyces sp. NPDC091272]|uniref:hypothetical protein n=1 Tax=Streptomyces sp. NPDC091272 TaxID=3365981 RepID=UPI0037FD8B7E
MRLLSGVVGILVLVFAFTSVTRDLITPRATRSALPRAVRTVVRCGYQFIADRTSTEQFKDRVLAPASPVAMLVLLLIWLTLFVFGYGLLEFALSRMPLDIALREAGSSVLTLGFASDARSQLTFVDFLAAATGPIVIGLQIGYLPTFYAAYARRESDVSMLRSRTGVPAWGPQLLARHAQLHALDTLPDLFRDWERWSAEVAESHANHPALIHFRSPSWERNWLLSLLAVLDAGALYLAFNPSASPHQLRVTLRAGATCLQELADEEHIPYNSGPGPGADDTIRLTYGEFLQGAARLREHGVPMERTPEQAWTHFRSWRAHYESAAYALALRIDAVPAPWSGPRRRVRAGARGRQGRSALV